VALEALCGEKTIQEIAAKLKHKKWNEQKQDAS